MCRPQEYVGRYQLLVYKHTGKPRFQVMEWLRGPLSKKSNNWTRDLAGSNSLPRFRSFPQTLYSVVMKNKLFSFGKNQHALPHGWLFPEWLKIKGRKAQKHQHRRGNLFSSKCENRSKAGIFGPKCFKKEVLFCFNRDIYRHVEVSLIQGKHWNNKLLSFACTFLMWRSQVSSKRSMWIFCCQTIRSKPQRIFVFGSNWL